MFFDQFLDKLYIDFATYIKALNFLLKRPIDYSRKKM
jgi:hypothetical protein